MGTVAIVGAGVAGLAAALAARREAPAGTRVIVLEAATRVGGKLAVSDVAGVAVDEGAEAVLARRPEGIELIRAAGLADDLIEPATLAASLSTRGRLRPLPRTVLGVPPGLAALPGVVSPTGIARAALDRMLPRIGVGADVSVGRYVGARLGREVVDRLVDPLLGGVYAGRADELSLAATMPDLARAARRHRSLLRAARAALRPPAPGPAFVTLRGGLGRLPAALAAATGAEIRTGCTVRALDRTAVGWRLTIGPTNAPERLDADAVVLATPAAAAARLLAAAVPTAAADLGAIDYASSAIVTLAYDAPTPAAGSGFLVPAVEGRLVKGVTFSSAKWGLPGPAVVRCSIGRYGDTADLQRPDDELTRAAAADLAAMTGLRAAPVNVRVTRWGGGLPQYAVGHLDRVARIRATVSLAPALAVCGAAYDGVGVPACAASGQRAGREVAEALRRR